MIIPQGIFIRIILLISKNFEIIVKPLKSLLKLRFWTPRDFSQGIDPKFYVFQNQRGRLPRETPPYWPLKPILNI